MNRTGLTLQEEAFCQLVALGKTAVEAYEEAYGKPAIDAKHKRLYTKRASNLSKRVEVASRIIEAKGEQKRRDREMWQMKGDKIAAALYSAIEISMTSSIVDPKTKETKPAILDKDTLHGIEVLSKMKGLNAPEDNVIKNGGVSDDYTPRGLEAVSDKDLDAIIRQGDIIDITEGDKDETAS